VYQDIGIQGLGEPHEIAAVAAFFLASDRSPLLNAAAIVADGACTAS
jgi:NAD(P)-dependent dehydrogenase (short-subunit alcohol dehydrogenase family)